MICTVNLIYLPWIYEYALAPKLFALYFCLTLACLGWLVRSGCARQVHLIHTPLILPLICFLGVAILSSWKTTHPLDTLVELANQGILVILFLVVSNALSFQETRPILWTCTATGLVIGSIGVLQYNDLTFFDIPSAAPPSPTFANRNLAAEYLVCTIPLSMILFLTSRNRASLHLSGLSGALMGTFLVYTRARGSWVGMVGALLGVGILLFVWKGLRQQMLDTLRSVIDRRKRILGMGYLSLFVVLSSLPPRSVSGQLGIKADVVSTVTSVFQKATEKDASIDERLSFWRSSIRMLADHPLLGVGAGGWVRTHPLYDNGETITTKGYHKRPHNDLLGIGSEYGLIGLGVYIWFLIAGFKCLRGMVLNADALSRIAGLMFAISILSLLGAGLFGFPKDQPPTAMFPYLLFGIAVGRTNRGSAQIRSPWLGRGLLALLVILPASGAEITRRRMGFDRHFILAYSWGASDSEGKWESVLVETDRALEYGNFRSDILFFKGLALQNLERYIEAEETYKQNLDYTPHAWYAHEGLGFSYLKQDRFLEGLTPFQTALSICPDANYIHGYIGKIYRRMGELDRAEQAFRAALYTLPDDSETHLDLGKLHQARGQLDSGIAYFQEALGLDPGRPEIHANLAYAHLLQGGTGVALAHYREAVQAYPGDANVQLGFGLALKAEGKAEEAVGAYRRAITIRPDLGQAHLALGNVSYEVGQFKEALKAYRTYLDLSHGDSVRVGFVSGRIEQCLRKIEK